MPLENYFLPYLIQSFIAVPDGFGGVIWQFVDGAMIMGRYIQDTSSEARIAQAQGFTSIGIFITRINVMLEEGDFLRDPADNKYIKIVGLPIQSPAVAESQFRRMNAQMVDKPG